MTGLIALAGGIVASAFLAGSAALAQDTYRFNIDGQTIRIEQPRNCKSSDCVSVSIPGYYERDGRRSRRARKADRERLAKEKAAAKSSAEAKSDMKPDPKVEAKSDSRLPPEATAAAAATAVTPDAKVAAASSTRALGPTASTASPLGIWLTEETNSKVKIEPCGDNLCGYAIDPKSGEKADKVLIDMAASGPKWTGRIFDPGNGNNFDSSIAMNGSDSLRVQGCPSNATFCGSQTWKRVN